MADDTMPSLSTASATAQSIPLTLIVAATRSTNGIGFKGGLPWPQLKSEMAYFARVTRRVPQTLAQTQPNRHFQNAVLMGRKTWESIPPKFRPLKGRTNVVITRQKDLHIADESVLLATGIQDGLDQLRSRFWAEGDDVTQEKTGLGRCFIIGGAEIYKAALDMDNSTTILCTSISEPDFNCDTFLPADLQAASEWIQSSTEELEAFTGEKDLGREKSQDDVKWKYELWKKDS